MPHCKQFFENRHDRQKDTQVSASNQSIVDALRLLGEEVSTFRSEDSERVIFTFRCFEKCFLDGVLPLSNFVFYIRSLFSFLQRFDNKLLPRVIENSQVSELHKRNLAAKNAGG